ASGTGGAATGTAGAGATGGAGGGGTAGATGTGGAAPACASGELRCDDAGRRMRCAPDGTWIDDGSSCTIALSGSSDYQTMCALKADGRVACWAAGAWANGQAAMMTAHAPAGAWRYISAGDGAFEICAVAATGL